jgi:arylsulfatase
VIDIAPTGSKPRLPQPTVNGVAQQPIEGVSWRTRSTGEQVTPRDKYFEISQPRHLPPGRWPRSPTTACRVVTRSFPAFDDDVWELYDTNTDWSQAHDLAAEMPEKLAELQEPGSRRRALSRAPARRPTYERQRQPAPAGAREGNSQLPLHGMDAPARTVSSTSRTSPTRSRLKSSCPRRRRGRDSPRAALRRLELVRERRRPTYCYNPLGLSASRSATAIPPGTHQVRMEFATIIWRLPPKAARSRSTGRRQDR